MKIVWSIVGTALLIWFMSAQIEQARFEAEYFPNIQHGPGWP